MNQEARRMQTIGGRMNVARIVKTWTSQSGNSKLIKNIIGLNGKATGTVNIINLYKCVFILE